MINDIVVSEFYGSDQYAEREAVVKDMGNGVFHVEMYDEEGLYSIRKIEGKTVQYCEDCAENWVIGVIKK